MSKKSTVTDRRLLSALDYIDQKYIDDVFDLIKEPDPADQKSSRFKVWKQVIMLAACLVLMAAAFPIIKYVIEYSDFFAGSMGTETPGTTSGMYDEYILTEEDLAELNEAYFRRMISYDPTYAGMSEEELNQIRNSKFGKYAETVEQAMQRGTMPNSRFYFGKYGGSIVVAINGMHTMGYPVELCGYRFLYTHTTMLVCYDSTFYYMTEAYEMGLLSEAHIERLHRTYTEYYSDIPEGLKIVPSDSPIELSDAEEREIVWSYIKYSEDEDKLDYTYSVECYGKFDGMYAVMIDVSGSYYSDAIRYEAVGDVEFVFPNGKRMKIYRWGEFYSLAEAASFVDEEDIMSIEWSKRVAFTYSETSTPIALEKPAIEDILRAYVDIYNEPGDKDLDYSLRCYGSFHENRKHIYVVFVDKTGKTYESKLTREEVNGLVFEYPTEQAMLVYPYDKHEFHTLTEAFESGLLTAEELYQVYTAYNMNE